MSHRITPKLVLPIACLALSVTPAAAFDIAANTSPNTYFWNNYDYYTGQSFTVTGSGSYTNIRFNFFTGTDPITPYAVGTGFLFSSAYTGLPGDLNSGLSGYLGQAGASGGYYDFGATVTLVAGVQYFFYSNGAMAPGLRYNSGTYLGGDQWQTLNSTTNFASLGSGGDDALFRVTGDAVVDRVPDSGTTAAMLGLGLLGLAALRRRLT